jgi:carbonic anhydrase
MDNKNLGVTQNVRFSTRLARITHPDDVPEKWRNTPIGALIGAHNFDEPITAAGSPQLLVATCIEYRFHPIVPQMYSYVIRRASGRLIGSEFSLVYVLSKGVRHVVLLGHDDCGMTQVSQHGPGMIATLIEQGWDEDRAKEYIAMNAGRYAIQDEVDSLKQEFFRLKKLFRKVEIAPLFISLASQRLYIPRWYVDYMNKGEEENNEVNPQDLLLMP